MDTLQIVSVLKSSKQQLDLPISQQPSISLSPASPVKEVQLQPDMDISTDENIPAEVPDFISLESCPGSPKTEDKQEFDDQILSVELLEPQPICEETVESNINDANQTVAEKGTDQTNSKEEKPETEESDESDETKPDSEMLENNKDTEIKTIEQPLTKEKDDDKVDSIVPAETDVTSSSFSTHESQETPTKVTDEKQPKPKNGKGKAPDIPKIEVLI